MLVLRFLTRDEDQGAACRNDDVGVCRRGRQVAGIDEPERHREAFRLDVSGARIRRLAVAGLRKQVNQALQFRVARLEMLG